MPFIRPDWVRSSPAGSRVVGENVSYAGIQDVHPMAPLPGTGEGFKVEAIQQIGVLATPAVSGTVTVSQKKGTSSD